MSIFKKLAGETAIYGMSSIIGRFLNWWLVPYYSWIFIPETYGIVTNLYSYVAFLMILLTYGMETGFFRFASKSDDRGLVYSTSLISLISTSLLFIVIILMLRQPIASAINYPDHSQYILWLAIIVAIDALTAIPFARLRLENRPVRFAVIKLINIGFNLGFNIFFFSICPKLAGDGSTTVINFFYSSDIGVGYVFISNLLASAATLILLLPQILKTSFRFDTVLLKRMLSYSFPILIVGLAGMVNQNIDKILIPFLVPENQNPMQQVGIYGANYKIAVLMNMFIQAFRYAFEPFFFSRGKNTDDAQMHADILKFFVIFGLLIFLGITLYIDVVKLIIDPQYHLGIKIVPIVLLANLFLGIYFTLSIWYKLDDKTRYGAYMALIGAGITLVLNFVLIPVIGYMGSAIAVFSCFLVMMVMSYLLGRKHYPIPYDVKNIVFYFFIALQLYFVSTLTTNFTDLLKFGVNSVLMVLFIILILFKEQRFFRGLVHKKNTN